MNNFTHFSRRSFGSVLKCSNSGCGFVQRRNAHDIIIRKRTGKPIVKYGPGGRSSVSGHVATVFGCTGFLGRYLVAKLAKQGTQVVIPYRDEDEKRHLKVNGDLGQVVSIEFDLRNTDAIVSAVRHSDIVYNLIGRDYETKNFSYEAVHAEYAAKIAQISAEQGVSRFVHVSALNADVKSASKFFRSKALGEMQVKDAFPDATIVRPAYLFGPEDRFLNRLADNDGWELLIRHNDAVVHPVNVIDVAKALEMMQSSESTMGETYEFYGTKGYTFAELYGLVTDITKKTKTRVYIPKSIALLYARLQNNLLPWATLSPDDIERMTISDKFSSDAKTFRDLGIEPGSLEATAITVLRRFRYNIYFDAPPDEVEAAKTVIKKRKVPFIHT
ncbi:5175_t:CDS:10 [Ambispora gerdemannii]|uniref:5175_t:CDS:1 n=1 Tax=Ambispora gerdemannii TaxID=144530 RepID=A0A9N9BI51_9GLOM|nr:5175_t:CDS:10 [Ambispora gerdemannii]